jgi:DNA mismatch repair protein MSH5
MALTLFLWVMSLTSSHMSDLTLLRFQSTVAEQICERMPDGYASSLNVVYFPQLGRICHTLGTNINHLSGFLICVPMLDEWRTEAGIQTIDGWSFQVRAFV